MDAAIGFMFSLLFLSIFIVACAIAYKNRAAIKKWLNTPYHAEDDRKLRLQRIIEDAEKELESIEKEEVK